MIDSSSPGNYQNPFKNEKSRDYMTKNPKIFTWNYNQKTGAYEKSEESVSVTTVTVVHDIDREPEKFEESPPTDYFDDIIKSTQAQLMAYLPALLFENGYSPDRAAVTKDYLYFEGDIPVLVIAHLDTVHTAPVTTIYQHKTEKYFIAREGIGGDDRCGVFAIIYMIAKGKRPYILFTTNEESGAQGARVAAKEFKPSDKILFMVEIDRRGKEDSVYYDNDNKDFKKYIDGFGFKEASGSFSDISVLGDAWNISSVNLSSGYYSAHSKDEKIHLDETLETAKKVMAMFDKLPEKRFEHVEKKYTYTTYSDWYEGWGDDYYGGFGGYGDVYQRGGYQSSYKRGGAGPTAEEIAIFDSVTLKQLRRGNECAVKILRLPFVEKAYLKVSGKDATPENRIKGPYFYPKGENKSYWVAELGKGSSKFASLITPREKFQEIQSCVNYLNSMYKQVKNYDVALFTYNQDPDKWERILSVIKKSTTPVEASIPAAPKIEKTPPTGPKEWDDLSATEQREFIYESMDCIEGLIALPFVKDISVENGKIDISISTSNISRMTSNFGTIAKSEIFKKELESVNMSEAEAFINCMMLLEYRVKTFNGFADELAKFVNDYRNELGIKPKPKQSTLQITPWEQKTPAEREAISQRALAFMEVLTNLKFLKGYELVSNGNYIRIVYSRGEGGFSINEPLNTAVVSADFQAEVTREKLGTANGVLETLTSLVKIIKENPGMLGELEKRIRAAGKRVLEEENKRQPKVESAWEKLSKDVQQSMLNRVYDGLISIASLSFVGDIKFHKTSKQITFSFASKSGNKVTTPVDQLLDNQFFVDQMDTHYRATKKILNNFIEWISATLKQYPEIFEKAESMFLKGGHGKTTEVEEKTDALSIREREILKHVVDLASGPKDTNRFVQLWKETGGDIDKAFEKYIGVDQKKPDVKTSALTERVFDDAPAFNEASRRNIVDRYPKTGFEGGEVEEKIDEDDLLEINTAIEMLVNHFNTYHFRIDEEDVSASIFFDEEGVERHLNDLKTEIDATENPKTRKMLNEALSTLLKYG